jgi:hypothetical protein
LCSTGKDAWTILKIFVEKWYDTSMHYWQYLFSFMYICFSVQYMCSRLWYDLTVSKRKKKKKRYQKFL